MNTFLFGPFVGGRTGAGLLIFRLVTGLALMIHGWPKIQHPLSWMAHSPVPPVLQACSALAEFGGGLALILGLLTPVACVLIAINMLVAIFMVHVPQGAKWIGGPGSFEPAMSYLVAAVMLFLTGPGRMSLDAKLFGKSIEAEPTLSPRTTEKVGGGV